MKKSPLLLAISLISLLPSCSSAEGVDIYCSFYPIYDFAKRLVPASVTIENITPSGVEPHDYEPSATKIAKMTESKAVFVNGLSFESWANSSSSLSEKIHVVTEGITTQKIEGATDPHVWLNPLNALIEAKNMVSVLTDLYPANKSEIEESYASFEESVTTLDSELKAIADSIPNKYIVTSHAAFGYFCEHYGFTQIYLNGLSPDEEPSAKEIESIIQAVEDYGINTIYYEEEVNNDIASEIAKMTGCQTMTLNPLETLSQERIDNGDDYLSVMRENMQNVLKGQQ